MKWITFFVLTAGLVLNSGCGKKETEATPKTETSELSKTQIPAKTAEIKAKVEATSQKLAQDARDTIQQTKETVEMHTAKAKETVEMHATQAMESLKSFNVSPEDIDADLTQPIDAIKEQIANFTPPQLMAYADQYKDIILEKTEQLSALTEQVKGLPMSDLFSTKGKALKDQVSQYTDQLSSLKDRYSVYLDKLTELGVDLSSFGL